jgi:hypothetical protein
MTELMNVHGRCHCGAIEFDAAVEPSRVTICHCTDCQILTGTAFRTTVRAATTSFVLRKGAPRIYVKTGDSGRQREHGFCETCGTPIFTRAIEGAPTFGLRVGCLDRRTELRPAQRIWCRSALAWSQNIEALPQQDTQ